MTTVSDTVEIITVRDRGLGNSSYVVDVGGGAAVVIDPSRDPRPYVAAARDCGWRIVATADTHLHADFLSGARELEAMGSRAIVPAGAGVRFAALELDDGEDARVGDLRLQALATPGHTPEHVSYLLLDGATPQALFGGGTVMIGGMARPDLIAPEMTEALARAAHRTVRQRLAALPDELPMYPTHGAGSFCASTTTRGRTSTLGDERQTNPLFTEPDEDAFVAGLLAGLGTYPPYFLRLRSRNQAGPRVIGTTTPGLPRLSIVDVDDAIAAGAQVIDVRPKEAFAAGHLPKSLSIPLRDQFAVWLGWLVEIDQPLVFVASEDTDRDDLVRQCLKIGYERVLGEVDGGVEAWKAASRPLTAVRLISPEEVETPGAVLDVRQESEWKVGRVAGAVHLELGRIATDISSVPEGSLLVHCAHGERAMTAASILERAGRTDVQVLAGSPDALGPR